MCNKGVHLLVIRISASSSLFCQPADMQTTEEGCRPVERSERILSICLFMSSTEKASVCLRPYVTTSEQ